MYRKKVYLAPMAGITDRAFRKVCSEFVFGGFTSEMVSVYGLVYNNEKTKLLTRHSLKEKPFSIQLFGREPDAFVRAVEAINDLPQKPEEININMGCPMPKIVNSGAGCALMREPALCGKIVNALVSNFSYPVSVKIRAGWDFGSLNAVQVAKICEENGASSITVHGRTRTQMYSGKCDLNIIKSVKNAVKIPVIGNGDVCSKVTYDNMLKCTGCDGVAIGRAAIGNPWIFDEILGKGEKSREEKLATVLEHFCRLSEYYNETSAVKIFKKHLLKYFKNIFKTSRYNEKICECCTKNDVISLIDLASVEMQNNEDFT